MISEILNRKMLCPNSKCRGENITLITKHPPYEYWRCETCDLRFATWMLEGEKIKK